MTGREASGRPRSRALRAVDIVILAADAVVVAFLLLLLGTAALAGTDSWLYTMTGGRVFALIMAPGINGIELVVYVVVAVAIIGPIWHGSVRPSRTPDEPMNHRLDADGMRFEYVSQDAADSIDSPDSTRFSANGGRRKASSTEQSDALGTDWTESVFDDTAALASRSTDGFTRTRLDGSSSTSQPETDAGTDPDEEDPVPDSDVRGDGASSPSDMSEVPPTIPSGSAVDSPAKSDDRSAGFGRSADLADPTKRIRSVISSSNDRIRSIEVRLKAATNQEPIESVQRRVARNVRDDHRYEVLENIGSGASPSPADAIAEVRTQERRLESVIPVEFRRSRFDS